MKIRIILVAAATAVTAILLAGCASEKCEMQCKQAKQAKLLAQAKISKDAAEKTALAKVPSGTVKEGELEMEKGKLIWSFDLATPDTKDITEVNIDANSGDVVGIEHEKPEADEKEDKK